ncbi:MAG: signal peptide peptidase SppA [Clostridia bacterium]|nr:signal peptide peptidase SppA [Clostridia bacterium]
MDNNEMKYSYDASAYEPKPEPAAVEYAVKKEKKGIPGFVKAILIIAAVIIGVIIIATVVLDRVENSIGSIFGTGTSSNNVVLGYKEDYIATVYVEDEIASTTAGLYNHEYIMNAIDALKDDEKNKGLILWIDTPGGSVYASDELYLKLKEYKATGKPIYSSYQNQSTSGGYYISCLSDKIIANRNCWTGSIGVTMGSYIEVSGLLEKLGIKVNTITAGKNKAMGSNYEEMTAEQRAILQSLVDESYEQFTGIVAEERKMDINKVIELADGRVYTAKQALENGLIDEIGTYEDTIDEMSKLLKNDDIMIVEFRTEAVGGGYLSLFGESNITSKSQIEELLALNETFTVSYMSQIRK